MAMNPIDTLPKQLVENARIYGNRIALREKEFGIWQSLTWAQYLERVRNFALGLHQLGFARGDKVAILGDNRPEWVISELAAQSLGGQSVGIYQDSTPEEVLYIADLVAVRYLVVEDQEQVDKVVEIWDRLSRAQAVIFYDPKGLRNYDQAYLKPFPEIENLGREFQQANRTFFEESVNKGRGEDVAIVSTTSGTTSKPKLGQITHDNLFAMAKGMTEVDGFTVDDQFVSFLPLAWIGEQMMSMACGMYKGFALSFPEDTHTVRADLREIGPHIMFAPPRIWESMVSEVQVKIEDADRLKKFLFNRAMKIGYRIADKKFDRKPLTAVDKAQLTLTRVFVFNNILDQLCLLYIKWGYTAGAALGPDVFRFYHAMGVNLKQGYGQTETTGLCVIHRDDEIKYQTVGKPFPGVEVKTDDNGEILVRGPVCFGGYFRNEAATAETITPDGWVRTGDAGYFDDDGHLIVIDRAKDVMTLQDGTRFSPQFIENKLKFSQYIKEAVVFGGEWPYVTAFINIDFANVGKWAEAQQIAYTTYTDLAQKSPVYDLIRKDVERTNADLPSAARIQKFLLLYKELDADDAELTRTRKVRRGYVAQTYHRLIDGLYSDLDSLDIESVITYQDGRTATIKVNLRIDKVNP
ncbi:MAG: AMP-binding protein [Anaerolineae bacterium]|nr:AMP-binding protein [Anaerolineae bacterium]